LINDEVDQIGLFRFCLDFGGDFPLVVKPITDTFGFAIELVCPRCDFYKKKKRGKILQDTQLKLRRALVQKKLVHENLLFVLGKDFFFLTLKFMFFSKTFN